MSVRKEFNDAVSGYRAATGMAETARDLAPKFAPDLPDRQRRLITQLAQAATVITPGWLGQALTRAAEKAPLGEAEGTHPLAVRIGQCDAGGDYAFPVVVNLLGTGHLFVDTDTEDPRVASLLRTVLLRLLAARGADSCRPLMVDDGHETFTGFDQLARAGLATLVDSDNGLATALDLAEAHVEQAVGRSDASDIPELILVAPKTPAHLVDRLARLAAQAVGARLHLIVGGWPGPVVTAATHVVVSDEVRVAGVAMPVDVDAADGDLVATVCRRMVDERRWFEEGL